MADLPSLLIVGAGGLGREVAALVEAINAHSPTWDLKGFIDDDETLRGRSVLTYPVLGTVEWLTEQRSLYFTIAIGDGLTRSTIAARLADTPLLPATLVHPSVSVHRSTEIGPGAIVCNGAAPTVEVDVGPHAVLDQHCTIGHQSTLGAFVTLHPGTRISGSVHLEKRVTMGAGSVALPEVRIGADTTVGAGAVVTDDLPANCTAVGVPATPRS